MSKPEQFPADPVQAADAAGRNGGAAWPVASVVPRTRLHRRNIELAGYRREDGLYDIEGHLSDVKDYDFGVVSQTPAGSPIHDMWLRITVDGSLRIVEAQAHMAARPYPGHCEHITPDYGKLIGLQIAPGFTNAVRGLLGGQSGCVHLTEMVASLATAAYQTLAGERSSQPQDAMPPHLDRCHALDTCGPVVQEFYPRWYRGPSVDG
jgi:hypothetical protein